MARFEVIMPKMGESIIEATITKWLKAEGDTLSEDDVILEIATDKVDSEIPSPVEGRLIKKIYNEGDTVEVGKVIAVIATEGEGADEPEIAEDMKDNKKEKGFIAGTQDAIEGNRLVKHHHEEVTIDFDYKGSGRFYSPLVKRIALKEHISLKDLGSITGTGRNGRLTKHDLLDYISKNESGSVPLSGEPVSHGIRQLHAVTPLVDEVIEMDRMRRLIADHMVMSVKTSPHVTSFVEVDMTPIVKWRDKVKDDFMQKHNEKLTFTHIFIEAIAKTVRDYPLVNVSIDGYHIIRRKNVNIGMAVALPSGNLIVPVVKKADELNLIEIVKRVNDLANRSRSSKLEPDEIQGGTITLTNLGSFGTLMGTPIINQPQAAIVAVGSIAKKPVVIETPQGDVIGIRHMMFLSLTYDHRIIDGAMGGTFINSMKHTLENFDTKQAV